MNEEAKSGGWDAIEQAMSKLYGDQEPKHYGTLIPYMLGGPDPLDGISAYKAEQPFPHWHIVTFGFSELYDKESDDAELSGYGFELTFRLARVETEEEPPAWALNNALFTRPFGRRSLPGAGRHARYAGHIPRSCE